jgi:DNA (cytosine-5)-methyltransferase 1
VLSEPQPTVTGAHRGEQALVTAFLAKHYGGVVGQRLDSTIGTVTAIDHHSLVTVHLDAQRRAEAEAFLMTRCEGVPDIRIGGGNYHIVDIGLRMLSPRELFNAQGFRPDYIIDRGADGAPFTKTEQIRMCGNSVCPPIAAAIISANVREMARETA